MLAKCQVAVSLREITDWLRVHLEPCYAATLDLEGQGRFALGYYHQKAEYRRRTAERKEAETNFETK